MTQKSVAALPLPVSLTHVAAKGNARGCRASFGHLTARQSRDLLLIFGRVDVINIPCGPALADRAAYLFSAGAPHASGARPEAACRVSHVVSRLFPWS